jgi:RHS repeat-associated protein
MHSPEARVALDGSLLFRGLSHGVNRLTQISSVGGASSASPISFNYTYNQANQRTKNVLADGSYWIYQYDSLGQATNGVKYFADGTLVPGQQFGYGFDDIGNRKQTTAGGDSAGANLRLANYSVNSLNQITQRDYPGTNDVVGASILTNAVTVNGQTAWRKGEYFQATVKSNNTAAAQWEGIQVVSGSFTNNGNLYVPKTPEQFSYDPDGNLTNDGRFAYVWDGENRLIAMTNNTGVGPRYGLAFAYDPQGRRIQKFVATNGVTIYSDKFLYDGWNLVAILNPQSSILESFMWGTDLSGSMHGAGGVGGLLEVSYYGTQTTNCFPAFDGNGNVMAYINVADGTSVAQLDYDPFLNVIRATGPMANLIPFLGSTKYYDWESGLYYYGQRYLRDGVWPSRDPLQEIGGLNLYGFVGNNPLCRLDIIGLSLPEDLILHYYFGGGSDLVETDQKSIDVVMQHGLAQPLQDLLDKLSRDACARAKAGQKRGSLSDRDSQVVVGGGFLYFYNMTLNQGHLDVSAKWHSDDCNTVYLTDIKIEYWDEIMWKDTVRKHPPGWNTYGLDNIFLGQSVFTMWGLPYDLGMWHEYMLYVRWNSPDFSAQCQ